MVAAMRVLPNQQLQPDSLAHVAYSAVGKEYRFQICNGRIQDPFLRSYSQHVYLPLDIESMRFDSLPRSFLHPWLYPFLHLWACLESHGDDPICVCVHVVQTSCAIVLGPARLHAICKPVPEGRAPRKSLDTL